MRQTIPSSVAWGKSPRSQGNGNCIEVSEILGEETGQPAIYHVRDSKHPDAGFLTFNAAWWMMICLAAHYGEFDTIIEGHPLVIPMPDAEWDIAFICEMMSKDRYTWRIVGTSSTVVLSFTWWELYAWMGNPETIRPIGSHNGVFLTPRTITSADALAA